MVADDAEVHSASPVNAGGKAFTLAAHGGFLSLLKDSACARE
jgi:hypothetical protein